MLELTADNAADYLRRAGWLADLTRVTELADGVSNAVLRVETPSGAYVLKQSRPQLRTREAWFSDLGRIWRERDVMTALRPHLPSGVVPEVLASDEANYAFLMSHAPEPFRNWRAVLLGGEVDPRLGERAGTILAAIHEASATHPAEFERFADRTVFEQLRVDPFYQRVLERRSEVAAAVMPIMDRLRSVRSALCHGDISPKNLLAHAAGFTLVDYETAHWGDPTMDLGFFLSHLLLKAAHRPADRGQYFELTRAFWRGYAAGVRFRPVAGLLAEGVGHLGVCLLARIDGTSPAPYLTDETKREAVRRLGRRLLQERPMDWESVLGLAEEEYGLLGQR